MNRWTEIRLAVLSGQISIREAAKKYHLNWRTIRKMLEHVEPPSYRRKAERPKKTLGPFVPIIHEILELDKSKPKKQRHTGKRIFERLCKEHGYRGGITVVRDEIRRWRQTRAEVFMPLHHPPGTAQFDFGEAKATSAPSSFLAACPAVSVMTTRGLPWRRLSAVVVKRRPASF